MQKELLAPKYAQEFMCTGPKCPDNCCQENWTINIDPATYKLYNAHPELSRLMQPYLQLNKNLTTKEQTPAFLKQNAKTGGCDLQEASGLCKIHKQFGIKALSSTCAIYPRQYQPLGIDQMLVMTESCPEVARRLVEDADALALDLAPLEVWDRLVLKGETEFNSDYHRRYELLQGLLTLLRYQSISLEMRLFVATLMIQRAEKILQEGDASELSMNDLLALFSDLINQGYFDKQVLLLKETEAGGLPMVILESLLGMNFKQNRFVDEIGKVLLGLGIQGKKDINTQTLDRLQQARSEYLGSLEKTHPWMLENVLVNWLLFTLFPIKKQRISDGWLDITTRYLLLRTLLSGLGAYQQKLSPDDASHLIYLFGRNISSSSKLQKLQLALVGKNLHQPAALVHALNL